MTKFTHLLHNVNHACATAALIWPELARFAFSAVLLHYYWASGLTKLGDGIIGAFAPSAGAYAQMFPKLMETAQYDPSLLPFWTYPIALAGTWAEFILPLLILLGLFTRLSALGMIGFIIVQSLTDLYGHGGIAHAQTLGAWFDRIPDSTILDQRLIWITVLTGLIAYGPGKLSLDHILGLDRKSGLHHRGHPTV